MCTCMVERPGLQVRTLQTAVPERLPLKLFDSTLHAAFCLPSACAHQPYQCRGSLPPTSHALPKHDYRKSALACYSQAPLHATLKRLACLTLAQTPLAC